MADIVFSFKKTKRESIKDIIDSHLSSFHFPMDSYLEENLDSSDLTAIYLENDLIGYAGIEKGDLFFFHIILKYYRHAHQAFEEFVSYKKLKRVLVITHDPLLCSIIMEWDYTVERDACWFIDGGRLEKPNTKVKDAVFRLALLSDSAQIIEKSGDFFDKLQERIKDDTIFVLEENGEHLGYGIIERGRYFPSCVSIGMICDKKHRKKGVGQTILWNLKELVYSEGKKPVAGCWYYNILSRKTLERAGMLAVAKGFTAVLKEKEKPPLRTGNRPGELVEG